MICKAHVELIAVAFENLYLEAAALVYSGIKAALVMQLCGYVAHGKEW